ncbi:venom allergen 5.02 [Galendromus occidentalis]|uniref:Venom allergen 5.02 n=1 Tax=Galendromus occidentalis TaxID=34638 RepID=A0AAJ7PBG8_9ACAR|nr:venom allergen 5.02 [Galendromus occidentalis]
MKFFAAALVSLLGLANANVCTQGVKKFCSSRGGQATACMNYQCSAAIKTSTGDENFKEQMLRAHNRYRTEGFQGQSAADMLAVSWSDELAQTALLWVSHLCDQNSMLDGGHDKCRVSPSFDSVGQNLAWGAGSAWGGPIDADKMAVKGWNDEKKDATNGMMFPFSPPNGPVIGHYTQVVWSGSYKIGCAYVTRRADRYGYQGWIACNYAQAGNMVGDNVFTRGSPGSKCPQGSSKSSNGLCTVQNEDALRRALGLRRLD